MPAKKPTEKTEQIETPNPKEAKAIEDTSANAVVSRLSPEPNTDTPQKVEYKTRKGNTISTTKG